MSIIDQAKKDEEKKIYRANRKKRRAEGEEDVSDDTNSKGSDFDGLSPDEQKARIEELKAKEKEQPQNIKYEVKLLENAKLKFTYQNLVDGLKNERFKKIAVCTGAGISVSAGIPDFRSPGSGIYANLQKYDLPEPESIFELEYFKEKPDAFYDLASDFLDIDKYNPTPTHYFIKLL